MKSWVLLIALLAGSITLAMVAPGAADDGRSSPVTTIWRYNNHSQELPFARNERAQSVWGSGACWSDCGAFCAWGLAGCLERDAQGQCIKLTDKCDRYCQRECRGMGGPFLPIEFPWE